MELFHGPPDSEYPYRNDNPPFLALLNHPPNYSGRPHGDRPTFNLGFTNTSQTSIRPVGQTHLQNPSLSSAPSLVVWEPPNRPTSAPPAANRAEPSNGICESCYPSKASTVGPSGSALPHSSSYSVSQGISPMDSILHDLQRIRLPSGQSSSANVHSSFAHTLSPSAPLQSQHHKSRQAQPFPIDSRSLRTNVNQENVCYSQSFSAPAPVNHCSKTANFMEPFLHTRAGPRLATSEPKPLLSPTDYQKHRQPLHISDEYVHSFFPQISGLGEYTVDSESTRNSSPFHTLTPPSAMSTTPSPPSELNVLATAPVHISQDRSPQSVSAGLAFADGARMDTSPLAGASSLAGTPPGGVFDGVKHFDGSAFSGVLHTAAPPGDHGKDNDPAKSDDERSTLVSGISNLTHRVIEARLSPDATMIVSASFDNMIRLFDSVSGSLLRVLTRGHRHYNCVAWSPDSATVVWAGHDRKVQFCNPKTGDIFKTIDIRLAILSIDFSANNKFVACGTFAKICLIDLNKVLHDEKTSVLDLQAHEKSIRSVRFSANSRLLLSGSDDTTVKLWTVPSGNHLHTWPQHTREVHCVSMTADMRFAASAGKDGCCWIYDLATFVPLQRIQARSYLCCDFSPTNQLFACAGGKPYYIEIYSTVTWRKVATLKGHRETINSCFFSSDGERLVSASGGWVIGRPEPKIRTWDVKKEIAWRGE
eukprot:Rmarinus@m.8950